MRFLKCYAVLLSIVIQIIAGCGGGGGGATTVNDTTVPTVSAFVLPVTATSLTVPLTVFTASDNVGVTGYMVTESATAPSAGDLGWSGTAPDSFTFSSAGVKTAYGWVKDAAGNVSASRTATVTITLPTTKTVTLKFSTQSTNPGDLINGFDLTVTLPFGSVLPTDSSGVPLPSAVFLSGIFAGFTLQDPVYDSNLLKLTVNYASTNNYQLGEFITIIFTVPVSYVPNPNDVMSLFNAWILPSGTVNVNIIATATFN